MSEITKLYENAGVLKECLSSCYINKTWRKTHDCLNCDNRENYPPFTAEKQIELIKWLMKYDEIHGDYNDGYGFSTLNYSGKYKKDFEESLASIINNELWQDLTEAEKEAIRGILRA